MAQQPPAAPPPQAPPPAASGGSGLQPNVAGVLAYLFGWVGGLVFILIEKENREVKFHAWQSIAFNVAVVAVYIIYIVFSIILSIVHLGFVAGLLYFVVIFGLGIVWILLMVRAYQGQIWKLPIIGDFAANQAGL
jgi:uncharacterized membrane protein